MSLVLNFVAFGAHVKSRTTLDYQVDIFALRAFQETVSNVAAAVSWFAIKPLVGDTSIITSIVRSDICATLGEAAMSTEILSALSVPLTIPTMIGLVSDPTAVVHIFGVPKTLEVAQADTQLTALIKGLLDAKSILAQYKVTVANSMAYEIFFGVTDTEIASAAKQLTDALGCSSLVLVQSAKKGAEVEKKKVAKRPAAKMESNDPAPEKKAVSKRPAVAISDVSASTEQGPEWSDGSIWSEILYVVIKLCILITKYIRISWDGLIVNIMIVYFCLNKDACDTCARFACDYALFECGSSAILTATEWMCYDLYIRLSSER